MQICTTFTSEQWKELRPRLDRVPQHNSAHVVYRTAFYRALRKEFDDYLGRLADASYDELRKNFLRKMDFIADTAPQAE